MTDPLLVTLVELTILLSILKSCYKILGKPSPEELMMCGIGAMFCFMAYLLFSNWMWPYVPPPPIDYEQTVKYALDQMASMYSGRNGTIY